MFARSGWLYDLAESYDLAFYITGSILAAGGFLVPLMPYLERLEKKHHPDDRHDDDAEEDPWAASRLGSVPSLNAV